MTQSIKDEIKKAFHKEYPNLNRNHADYDIYLNNWVMAAKWMAERLEKEFNPDPAVTGRKSNVSERIHQLARELE